VNRPACKGVGNSMAHAASSRYTVPPLGHDPSGNTVRAMAKGLIMTGRVLRVVTDRLLTTTAVVPAMLLSTYLNDHTFHLQRATNQP